MIEAMVALTMVGFALVLALPLLALEVRLDRRLEARREVRSLLEFAAAQVRVTGDVAVVDAIEFDNDLSVANDLDLTATFEPEPGGSGLWRLELEAQWRVGAQLDRLTQTTIVWADR